MQSDCQNYKMHVKLGTSIGWREIYKHISKGQHFLQSPHDLFLDTVFFALWIWIFYFYFSSSFFLFIFLLLFLFLFLRTLKTPLLYFSLTSTTKISRDQRKVGMI